MDVKQYLFQYASRNSYAAQSGYKWTPNKCKYYIIKSVWWMTLKTIKIHFII